jgi:hypothetical protein
LVDEQHRLDSAAIGEPDLVFARAVPRIEAADKFRLPHKEALVKVAPHFQAQITHLVERSGAPGNPAENLVGTERGQRRQGFSQFRQRQPGKGDFFVSAVSV